MGIKYSFTDNEVYGTEDVNEIAACLTGAGIAPFLSKDSYSTSDLNTVTAALTTDGVNMDGCKCTVENPGTAQMCAKVEHGIIFFESGVRLIVDEMGYSVPLAPNTSGYVFAHFSPSLQKADILFAAELPADGEYVELAKISASGGVRGLRRFARSKVGTMGRNAILTAYFTPLAKPVPKTEGTDTNQYANCKYIMSKVEGVAMGSFNLAHIGTDLQNGDPQEMKPFAERCIGLFDLASNSFHYICDDGDYAQNGLSDNRLTYISHNGYVWISFEIIDGELCMVYDVPPRYVNEINVIRCKAVFI